jgi:very-short-patch-repair endonuclease
MIESETLWKIAGSGRSISPVLLARARELRKQQTSTEEILWECLRDRRFLNAKFRRQHNIGQFIADFYCHAAKLVVELDGEIHQVQQIEDANRDLWMEERGLIVLRFRNDEVLDDLVGVLCVVAEVIEPSPLAPLSCCAKPSGNPTSAHRSLRERGTRVLLCQRQSKSNTFP